MKSILGGQFYSNKGDLRFSNDVVSLVHMNTLDGENYVKMPDYILSYEDFKKNNDNKMAICSLCTTLIRNKRFHALNISLHSECMEIITNIVKNTPILNIEVIKKHKELMPVYGIVGTTIYTIIGKYISKYELNIALPRYENIYLSIANIDNVHYANMVEKDDNGNIMLSSCVFCCKEPTKQYYYLVNRYIDHCCDCHNKMKQFKISMAHKYALSNCILIKDLSIQIIRIIIDIYGILYNIQYDI